MLGTRLAYLGTTGAPSDDIEWPGDCVGGTVLGPAEDVGGPPKDVGGPAEMVGSTPTLALVLRSSLPSYSSERHEEQQ